MESASTLRSLYHSIGTALHVGSALERYGTVHMHSVTWPNLNKSPTQSWTYNRKLLSSSTKGIMVVSCARTSESIVASKSDVWEPNGALKSDSSSNRSLEKKSPKTSKFPSGFEDLILEVCDQTEIAELKLKVGDFEMHLKRNLAASIPIIFPTAATSPSTPSESVIEPTASGHQQSPPKSSTEKISPFTNVAVEKSKKLAALWASGASGYVLVSSPTVGSFRRGRTLKGKKQPPTCKEGDVIKEGQVIGFLDQFGTELPVKSDVAGRVLKLLFEDGEAVGYGDPLVAVLPS